MIPSFEDILRMINPSGAPPIKPPTLSVKFPISEGHMIHPSKSGYCSLYPEHIVVFNANVCVKEYGKVWWGDLDLHKYAHVIQKWCDQIDKTVYVLSEHDARFQNEENPLYDRAVAVFTPGSNFAQTQRGNLETN